MPNLQIIYYILGITTLTAGAIWGTIRAAISVGKKFGTIETIVTEIRDNHLVHISEDLKEVKSAVGNLQQRVSKLEA